MALPGSPDGWGPLSLRCFFCRTLRSGRAGVLLLGRQFHGRPQLIQRNYSSRREASGAWSAVQDLQKLCPTVNEKTALSVRSDGVDVVLTGSGGLFLLRSADEGRNWSLPEFIPGADGLFVALSPAAIRHPSGKTYLVFVRTTAWTDGDLYLTSFE